jgi:transposase-like protein
MGAMFEIRKTRTVAQGPRKLTREREEYFRLVQQGVSYGEAARAVGINLRKGKRWRNGRNSSGQQKAAPRASPVGPPSGASRYLREADRIHIADRLLEKATVRAIAAERAILWEVPRAAPRSRDGLDPGNRGRPRRRARPSMVTEIFAREVPVRHRAGTAPVPHSLPGNTLARQCQLRIVPCTQCHHADRAAGRLNAQLQKVVSPGPRRRPRVAPRCPRAGREPASKAASPSNVPRRLWHDQGQPIPWEPTWHGLTAAAHPGLLRALVLVEARLTGRWDPERP